jgi:hypothetical protein
MPTATKDQPLDPRCKEAHPECIVVGDETFVRDDVLAKQYGRSQRTQARDDAKGAPYLYIAAIKYRPLKKYEAFILSGIQERRPEPPKRRRRTRG